MLRALRDKTVVWYAPDQVRSDNSGQLMPFFGVPAMINTATSRIARAGGAVVIPFFYRRLADSSGYLLRFEPPLEDLPSGDTTHDTTRLISVLERFIRECPEQYFWIHRKFRGRPAELPDAYAEKDDGGASG